jgi:hypothetical protein
VNSSPPRRARQPGVLKRLAMWSATLIKKACDLVSVSSLGSVFPLLALSFGIGFRHCTFRQSEGLESQP